MAFEKKILRLYDSDNRFAGVFVPADVWEKVGPAIINLLNDGEQSEGPNASWDDFRNLMRHWDFPYAYDPKVSCPNCKASSKDWRQDNEFLLHNANLGGLLVFKCASCGATIRHKYFKDRVAVECDPG